MPSLPLVLVGGVPIDGGDLPVSDRQDVAAQWSEDLERAEVAPVRDAIQAGQTALFLEYQRRARYAAAQSDPARATDAYADEIGSYEHGIHRQPGESNEAYRARYLAFTGVVDPDDIIAAANAVLAPYTSISARYAETSDGWFRVDPPSSWSSHVFDHTTADDLHAGPQYPDRLYPDAAPAGAPTIPNRRPPGAMANFDVFGRWFLLRVPDVSVIDSEIAGLYDAAPAPPDALGFFASDGSGAFAGVFLFDFSSSVDGVYDAVIGAVTAIVGQGIRWDLSVDPLLQ